MTAGNLAEGSGRHIDAAIAAGAYEVVALRLFLGLIAATREARLTAEAAVEELLELLDELGTGR